MLGVNENEVGREREGYVASRLNGLRAGIVAGR
jgi:hypothetical protein